MTFRRSSWMLCGGFFLIFDKSTPNVLYDVQIRTIGSPLHDRDIPFFQALSCDLSAVTRGIVLLKDEGPPEQMEERSVYFDPLDLTL